MKRLSLRQLANYILHGDAHLSPVDGHPGHPIVRFSGVQGINEPFGLSLDDLYRERVARNEQEDRAEQDRERIHQNLLNVQARAEEHNRRREKDLERHQSARSTYLCTAV